MVIRVFSVHHRILRKPNHGLITSSPLSNLEFADLASQQAHNALTEDRLALGSRQRFSEPLTAGLKPISSGNAGLSGERRETGFAVKTPWRTPSYRKRVPAQPVDATLACSLLAGVSKPKVFRGR
jgi:hypothetical protein